MALTIGYQGVSGAYSEKASRELLGNDIKAIGYPSFEHAFRAVQSGEVTYGILPIQNSLGGSIHMNYDLLMRYELHIVAELDFKVQHTLLVNNGVSRDQIRRVISHPQALAQCDEYLRRHNWEPAAEYDTAGSAKMLKENGWTDTAAIASDLAAEIYDLTVLDQNIEDDPTGNYTRFLLLSRTALQDEPSCIHQVEMKTSVVFAFGQENKTGQLHKALAAFALRDIDLTKVESRPEKNTSNGAMYRYLFYVDFIGDTKESNVQCALNHLREFCPMVRVLGCYPTKGILLDQIQRTLAARCTPSRVGEIQVNRRLRIGIIGFGNFGQFLAKTFALHHEIFATSRTDYSAQAKEIGATFVPMFDLVSFMKNQLDVVLIATSIPSFEKITNESILPVLQTAASQKVLVVDVLSVKKHPKQILLDILPSEVDILCTHPMFGPESGKYSWRNLPMMFDRVRVTRPDVCDTFLSIFEREHCRMIEMTCEKHDEYAASSQFITHLTGRMLDRLTLSATPIDTTGFKSLLNLIESTCKDSFDLFFGLYKYNKNSQAQIDNLRESLDQVVRHLELKMLNGTATEAVGCNKISALTAGIAPSRTIAIHATTKKLENQGVPVVSLCVGEPDFAPHPSILEAVKQAMDDGHTKYTGVAGSEETRCAIADYLLQEKHVEYSSNEILVTNGGKQAVYQAILSICERNDQVLIPTPYWVSYPQIVRLAGATPVMLPRTLEDGYLIDPERLAAAITPQTRALIFCNPCNPTGALHSRDQLQAIADVLHRPENQHVCILSDEIYERLSYDLDHVCFASLPHMRERTLLINGFSKGFAMTGFRLGYLAGPSNFIRAATTLQGQITSCASSIAQKGATAALSMSRKDQHEYREKIVSIMRRKRDFLFAELSNIPNLKLALTQGAFYLFPNVSAYFGKRTPKGTLINDSESLCLYLLEEYHTALVPGSAFGETDCIRFAYATSMANLEKGVLNLRVCLTSLC